MALVPLANAGNYLHVYDFRVQAGKVAEFIARFNEFDYSDDNPMHRSPAQVRDGVLVQDTTDEHHFWLIAEWSDIEAHARILQQVAAMKPRFAALVEGSLKPAYGLVVSSTPQGILDKAVEAL